jgi:hypothetical protein
MSLEHLFVVEAGCNLYLRDINTFCLFGGSTQEECQ